MGIFNPVKPQDATVVNQVSIGGIAPVFRSGEAYKAVGESVSRTTYPALSAAFPRNGSFSSVASTLPSGPTAWAAVAYGNGIFVALSTASTGATAVSYDLGKSWSAVAGPAAVVFVGITFGNGVFVALRGGGSNVCYTSPDGLNWTAQTIPNANWKSVTFGGGVFVAISGGPSNIAASSPDGITWTARTLPTSSEWSSVTYGNGLFVAVTSNSGGGTAAASSANGIAWTARTLPVLANWNGVAYGNGIFFAVSSNGAATSTDGAAWTWRPLFSAANTVTYGNGVFVMAGNSGLVCTTVDGIIPRNRVAPVGGTASAYGDGAFAVIGAGVNAAAVYAENTTDSDYLYLSGTAGQFVRVK